MVLLFNSTFQEGKTLVKISNLKMLLFDFIF